MTSRGALHWADLGSARGSAPAKRRPVLVIQSDRFTDSGIATVIVAIITSNTRLANLPGNVFLPATTSGLPHDSVVNLSQVLTADKVLLEEQVGTVPAYLMSEVDAGLRKVLAL